MTSYEKSRPAGRPNTAYSNKPGWSCQWRLIVALIHATLNVMTKIKAVPRLYEQFQPDHYELQLALDDQAMTFTGTVTVTGQRRGRPSQRFTFHQKDLVVTSARITHHGKKDAAEVVVDRMNTQKTRGEVRLHSKTLLYPGQYTVTMDFRGTITDQMNGMYPCRFNHDGVDKKIIATQFESHHAREVFPCIDEPEAKATFRLQLTATAGQTVLSNTPVETQAQQGAQSVTTFEQTPRMSTYLLAFAVGDIHCVEGTTKRGIAVRTWASLAQPTSFLQYANDRAIQTLDFFEEYFDTPFPLPKCDQIALPDFESGAMENWGLITYREIALLADPNNRSLSSEQYVAMVIAHELSHQWFGNLVTMKWWDDLWLNESFASLMEHIALDRLNPDWHQWETYVASDVLSCSNRDIYKAVQPVRLPVHHPDEIYTIFDPAIVYAKGGHLLKMLREYIGDAAFRKGLTDYFKKHAYHNTTGADLWESLSKASGRDITAFMTPWLTQSGSPLLRVERPQPDTLTLSQSRFLLDGTDQASLWPIPLLASKPLPIDILDGRATTLQYSEPTPVFNYQAGGHYLVDYAETTDQQRINQAIAAQTIPAESRMNILNDMMLLARRGDKSVTDLLELVRQCPTETRDGVWILISRAIGFGMQATEGDEQAEQGLRQVQYDLAHQWYKKLGWTDKPTDDPNTKLLRQSILSLMVGSEDQAAIDTCITMFKKAASLDDLPSEQRSLIIGAVVRHDPTVDLAALFAAYQASHNPEVQNAICAGLSRIRDPKHIATIIDAALGPKGFVRPQDIFRWYAYFMRSRYTREATWQWLTSNWKRLEKLFGDSKSFEHFVVYSASPINTPDWQTKFRDFFDPMLDNIVLQRAIRIAHGEIAARIAWRKRDEQPTKDYLLAISSD